MTPLPTIDQLRDLHLPPEPALWPPAPGWWVVAFVLALGGGLAWWRAHRRGPLRRALGELDALAQAHRETGDAVRFAVGVSSLVRRYAQRRFPDDRIAGLTGIAWLAFLDAHGGDRRFAEGPGMLLESLPYAAPGTAVAASAVDALTATVRDWLETNAP